MVLQISVQSFITTGQLQYVLCTNEIAVLLVSFGGISFIAIDPEIAA